MTAVVHSLHQFSFFASFTSPYRHLSNRIHDRLTPSSCRKPRRRLDDTDCSMYQGTRVLETDPIPGQIDISANKINRASNTSKKSAASGLEKNDLSKGGRPTAVPLSSEPNHSSFIQPSDSRSLKNGAPTETTPESSSVAKAYFGRRKKEIVDRLMAIVMQWLDENLSPYHENVDAGGSYPGRSGKSPDMGRQGKGANSLAGQKRLMQDDQDDSPQNNDDESGKDRDKKRTKTETDDSRPKFACPYFKRFPGKFKGCRTCCGPGWTEVHRVKEHLTRHHKLSRFKCSRCFEAFAKADELTAHQRRATPCPVRDEPAEPRDLSMGYDKKQEDLLNQRHKKMDEAEKWRVWFRILFNLGPTDEVPSPYYDSVAEANENSPANFTQQFAAYMHRELPGLVRHELEHYLETELNVVESKAAEKVIDILTSASSKLLWTFESIPPPASASDRGSKVDAQFELPPLSFDPGELDKFFPADFTEYFDPAGESTGSISSHSMNESSATSASLHFSNTNTSADFAPPLSPSAFLSSDWEAEATADIKTGLPETVGSALNA